MQRTARPDAREFASREGRPSMGRSGNPGQNERRFSREMDSYYGRPSQPQGSRERSFQRDDDFRPRGGISTVVTAKWPRPKK